ncbi:MAG TPA: DUF3256 family protein [Paludibacteraceae bacterium]|nr:DUF3256 family protein [Paludibacteraceae bacterium]
MKLNINKLVFFSLLIFNINFGVQAQDIIKYFTDMPAYLLPSLESSHKLELIENYQKTGKDTLENLFGGKVTLLDLDTVADYISIRTTSVSRFEMMLFQREDKSSFITVINTVCAPVCSSYIHFFDTEWKEIRMEFPKFDNRQWLKSTDETIDGVKLQDMIKGIFLEFNFNPHEKSVEVRNNSVQMLGKTEQGQIKPFFMEDKIISVKWKEGKWR